MTTDPMRTLVEEHQLVSEWLSTMWNAMGLLDGEGPEDLIRLQAFLRANVREHFEFEERHVFPALLSPDVAPTARVLVNELRREHVEILGDCSRLFSGLSWAMASDDSVDAIRALKKLTREIIDKILAHAAREDRHLLPLVQEHLQAISKSIESS